jgi:5,6-dimethylbenzimidazole synthase
LIVTAPAEPTFDDAFAAAFTTLLRWRRDVRHFRPDPIAPDLLDRLLDAACLAPSVGYSQPWRFVLVESEAAREAVRANFEGANAEALGDYQGERAKLYASLKLAGLRDAPVQLAVFTDAGTQIGHGLGRKTMPETLAYSTVMAIQNFWLAARSANIGVGWVSILDPDALRADLAVDPGWSFTAYLCVGYPQAESDRPELARRGWEAPHGASRELLKR